MIDTSNFYNYLKSKGVDFFAGVPDSLLKDICAFISDNTPKEKNIITANEGGAIALGAGYHLATNKIPLIYMQNSGLGNAVNPLLSLADKEVYSIPMLLLIGWRGEPEVKDEPQHIKQGKVTISMLESMDISYYILDGNCDYEDIIASAVKDAIKLSSPIALVIKKNTFIPYKLINTLPDEGILSREEALEYILDTLPSDAIIVSTTGKLSRELFELRVKKRQNHESDFLTVGSMGHASQIALGIAIAKTNRKVFCFDGDGALIMHCGHMGIIGTQNVKNFYHLIFNNSAHDSVGGQPTIGNSIDLKSISIGNNYNTYSKINNINDFENLEDIIKVEGPSLIEIIVKKGSRKDLGRPTITPLQNKELFKTYIQK